MSVELQDIRLDSEVEGEPEVSALPSSSLLVVIMTSAELSP